MAEQRATERATTTLSVCMVERHMRVSPPSSPIRVPGRQPAGDFLRPTSSQTQQSDHVASLLKGEPTRSKVTSRNDHARHRCCRQSHGPAPWVSTATHVSSPASRERAGSRRLGTSVDPDPTLAAKTRTQPATTRVHTRQPDRTGYARSWLSSSLHACLTHLVVRWHVRLRVGKNSRNLTDLL